MYKVLIAENDPMVAMINEQYVSRHKDFCVAEKVRDGACALEYLQNNSADLIILDALMPNVNGFETLRQIRNSRISVDAIIVTAANDTESVKEGIRLGVVDYVLKPFTFERFQSALNKFASQANALKNTEILNQKNIDFLTDKTKKTNNKPHPKGIQEKTLNTILSHLKENEHSWLTGDEISEKVNLTNVTVRKYLTYLTQVGRIIADMNYETGGRPCVLYKISN